MVDLLEIDLGNINFNKGERLVEYTCHCDDTL